MATKKEYADFIVETLKSALSGEITCKPMMGEYLLYYNGVLFGGIYDGRFLVKTVADNKRFNMPKEIPYNGAKPMFMPEDIENSELIKEIVEETYTGLINKNGEKK